MNSEKIYDINKIEKLLVKNWTEYIDARKMINFLTSHAKSQYDNPKIHNLKVSNCNLLLECISLWVEYNIINSSLDVNVTSEIFLLSDGTLKINRTI
jgi:spore coat protein CotF